MCNTTTPVPLSLSPLTKPKATPFPKTGKRSDKSDGWRGLELLLKKEEEEEEEEKEETDR